MKCMVCNNVTEKYDYLTNVPIRGGIFKKIPCQEKGYDVEIYKCPFCGHSQIPYMVPKEWYDTYMIIETDKPQEMCNYYSTSFTDFYLEKFLHLSEIACDTKNVLDIGCSVGVLTEILSKYFDISDGVECSKKEIEFAKERINGYVYEGYFEEINISQKYSAFICLDLLEHVENIEIFLRKALDILKNEGGGYIVVPNGEKIITQGRWYDVLVEHISYFSKFSLEYILRRVGFDLVYLGETHGGWWLEAYVKKGRRIQKLSDKRVIQKEKFKRLSEQYSRIGVWGAGNKGSLFVKQLSDDTRAKIYCIFDKNPSKIGKYIPGGGTLRIEFPLADRIRECDIILITALEYKDEILRELEQEYMYDGAIVLLD